MNVVNGFKKFSNGIDKICLMIVVIMLGLMVLITAAQIIGRISGHALQWSEEATRYLLIWSTFLGASCVYKSGAHISITFIQNLFPPKVQRGIQIFVHFVCIVTFCAVVYYGLLYAGKQSVQTSPSLGIPMQYMYLVVPIGFSLMIIHAINAILEILHKKGGVL